MELIKKFGFDPVILVAQIVNFVILLYILKRFLYKPVLDVLRKRQKQIEEGIKNAEKGNKMLEEATVRQKDILKNARQVSEKIINDAKTKAEELVTLAQEQAKRQSETMLQATRIQMQEDLKEAEKRLMVYVSSLAIEFLEKSLKDFFPPKEQKQIVKRAIRKIEQAN